MPITIPMIAAALSGAPLVMGGMKDLYNWYQGPSEDQKQQELLQDQIQKSYGQGGLGLIQQLQQMQNPLDIGALQQQSRQQFQQQTVPQLAERFSGMNAGRSSAFNQQLAQAGTGLEGRLAAMGPQFEMQRRGLDLQRMGQLGGLLGMRGQQQLAGRGLGIREQQQANAPFGMLATLLQQSAQGSLGKQDNIGRNAGFMGTAGLGQQPIYTL